jgi:hypothetical protein
MTLKCQLLACVLVLGALARAQSNPIPFINQLEPVGARPGSNNFELTILGTDFAPTAIVNWNGSPRTTVVVSNTRIKAEINASDIAQIGTASVTVVNPAPGGGTSLPAYFPIRRPLSAVALAADNNLSIAGSAAVGDFNNDGKLDVVVVENQYESQNNAIYLYYGNGDGTFQPPIQSSTNGADSNAVVGDFNGDGILDLAVSEAYGCCSFTRIYLGSAGGTFTEVADNNPPPSEPIGVGDFNHDGKLDLEILEYDYEGDTSLGIALGNGDGTFSDNTAAVGTTIGPAIADFNQDGNLDVATLSPEPYEKGSGLYVMFGNGDGTFQPPIVYPDNAGGAYEIAVDVNGDGILDIVTSLVRNNVQTQAEMPSLPGISTATARSILLPVTITATS